MKLPLTQLSSKMQATGISSTVVVLLLWIGEKRGWELTPEVAAAVVALVGFAAGYLTTERAYSRD